MFSRIIARADLTKNNRFGNRLKKMSKSDKDKTKFLLRLLPSYYSNTMENIRTKDYNYDNIMKRLKKYILHKPTTKNKKRWKNLIVLKTESVSDNKGRKYEYCIAKRWVGKGH